MRCVAYNAFGVPAEVLHLPTDLFPHPGRAKSVFAWFCLPFTTTISGRSAATMGSSRRSLRSRAPRRLALWTNWAKAKRRRR